jgi:putative transposase
MVSVPARRQQVAYGRGRGLSARRACTLFSVARSALEYRSRKAAKDAPVVTRMKELSAQYPRYGYRRIRIFLNRDGHRMSPGRAHRLWQTARLQVPRKRPRKRIAAAPRPRPQAPSGPNQVWCYDFVFDHCANGQQLKCLTVADEFTKEGLAIDVDGRIRSGRVIEVLSRLVSARGAPRFLRSDNGPEFVSKALLSWIVTQGIGTALIEPGKPWQNGVAESFNGKFRDECLSLEWFRSRAEAKVLIEEWRRHFNEVRPHSSLGYLTPNEFVARGTRPAPRHATGRDATVYGASAPRPVAQPSPRGQMQRARECRLKLTVVRRTWAAQHEGAWTTWTGSALKIATIEVRSSPLLSMTALRSSRQFWSPKHCISPSKPSRQISLNKAQFPRPCTSSVLRTTSLAVLLMLAVIEISIT